MTQYPRKSNLHSSRLASHKMNPHMNWSVEKERNKFHLMLDNCQKTISRISASEDWSSHPAFRIRYDVIVGQSQLAINAVSFTKNWHTNEKNLTQYQIIVLDHTLNLTNISLIWNFFFIWRGQKGNLPSPVRELNSRPLVYKTSALTAELTRRPHITFVIPP